MARRYPPSYPAGEGEFLSISERLVVSPQWGRFHGEPIEEGRTLAAGMVMGTVVQGRDERFIRAPGRVVLLQWLAYEGQWVSPGTPLARLRLSGE